MRRTARALVALSLALASSPARAERVAPRSAPTAAAIAPSAPAAAIAPTAGTVSVRFVTSTTRDRNDTPTTRVAVLITRPGAAARRVNLARVVGDCGLADAPTLAAPVVAELRCWWAGQGDTFRVVTQGQELWVHRRAQDEGSGGGENAQDGIVSRTPLRVRRADLVTPITHGH